LVLLDAVRRLFKPRPNNLDPQLQEYLREAADLGSDRLSR